MYFKIFKHGLYLCIIIVVLTDKIPWFSHFVFTHSLCVSCNKQGFHGNLGIKQNKFNNQCKIDPRFIKGSNSMWNIYTFISPNSIKSQYTNRYSLSAKKFEFDERAARRLRHRQQVAENTLRKKLAKKTMKKIVESITSEEYKELQFQKFISDVQYNPNRKRLPIPPDIYSPSYDALLYLKGLPYMAKEKMVYEWLKKYDIVSVVFIKNENGFFTGDAYVRCQNIQIRDQVAKEMGNRMLGGRYIQVFRVNENAYLEYYHSGCRKEPKDRNYMDPSLLVITNNQFRKFLNGDKKEDEESDGPDVSFVNNLNSCLDISDIRTGVRLVGTVTEIYRNGVIVDCNISETRGGVKEKVFCILKKNRIAKNIGLQGQQYEWLRMKQLVLYPGVRLNLYVEKVRETTAQNTFDQDMWTEHFHDSLIETYFGTPTAENTSDGYENMVPSSEIDSLFGSEDGPENGVVSIDGNESEPGDISISSIVDDEMLKKEKQGKRSLVYLTMDSSVSEDKVLWWEKKILNDVLSRHQTRNFNDIVLQEDIKETIKSDRILTHKVKVKEIQEGKVVVYGNQPNQLVLDKDNRDTNNINESNKHNHKNSASDVDLHTDTSDNITNIIKTHSSSYSEYNPSESIIGQSGEVEELVYDNLGELPEDVPIANLLNHKSEVKEDLFVLDKEMDHQKDKIEFVDSNYQKLANRFFKNTTMYDKDIQLHNFDEEAEDDGEEEFMESEESLEDYNWTLEHDSRIDLDSFPKLSLYDGAIKIPPNGLILRASEVDKLKNEHIEGVLDLLGKDRKKTQDDNRDYLVEIIRTEGIPNELLPQTLIQRGLRKVKESRKYMKNIINLTKDLTGRRFSQEDLDAASKEELEMLVEEGLYKFLNWNPPFDIKKQFITNYHHLLEDNIAMPTISEVVPIPEFIKRTESVESEGDETTLTNKNDENLKIIEKMWNDMKWLIVIFIYGEKNDLKEIVKQIENNRITADNANKLHSLHIESKED